MSIQVQQMQHPMKGMKEGGGMEDASKLWDWPLQHNDGIVRVINDQDHFEVGLDAQHFLPKEIQVKVIGEFLEINFNHEPRKDEYGSVSRSVTRNYRLPKDVDPATVKSQLNNRGQLMITAEKKKMR